LLICHGLLKRLLNQSKHKKKIIFWLTVGIFIRLVFMPFAAHKDFLASYSRANEISQGERSLFEFDQPLSHLIQVVNLKIFSPLLPQDKLPLQENYQWPYEARIPKFDIVHRALFIFKIPYLLFELGAVWVLAKLLKNKKDKLSLVKFWMVNPLLIFTLYIYGRYDAFCFFTLSLVLLTLKQKKNYLSALLLGVSVLFRMYPLLFVPVFVLLIGDTLKNKTKLLSLAFLPYATWLILKFILGSGAQEFSWVVSGPHQSFLYSFAFTLDQGFIIYPFFASYFALLIWLWLKKPLISFGRISLIIVLLFLSLSVFLPNYPVWMFPFLALFLVGSGSLKKLHLLQIIAFVMILPFWNNPLFLRLFAPISERALLDFPVRGLVSVIYPAQKVINLGKTIFSVSSLFMVYELLPWKLNAKK